MPLTTGHGNNSNRGRLGELDVLRPPLPQPRRRLDGLVAALGDDVGRAELLGQLLAVGVPGQGDDALCAETLGGEHAGEPDGAVADDRDRLAGLDVRADGGVVAGVPSLKAKGAMTSSPFLMFETSAPTSSTTPMNSWPIGPGENSESPR
jgi:hypothetical protein